MQVNSLTTTFDRIMSAQKDITTPNYSKVRSRLEWDRRMVINQIPTITAEMLKEDEHKAYITNKPLVYAKLIQALEADGLIPPIAKDNPGNPPISEKPNKPAASPPQKTGSLLLPVLLGFIGAIAILFAFWRRKK